MIGMNSPGQRASATKSEWRAEILRSRSAVDSAARAREADALAVAVRELGGPGSTVCAYVPIGREPGSPAMLDELVRTGARVLLPIAEAPGPLRWARYTGADDLVPAAFGLREPSGPRLHPSEIDTAAVVLVPALAVDRAGNRLGRGAGYYDRSLILAAAGARLIAVVRDDEVVAALPHEPHDARVQWALTPIAGLVPLGS